MNLASIIDGHPDAATALISRNRTTTYGELRALTAAVRSGLAGRGIAKGDRVALLFGNERDFVVSYLALLGLGAIAVPLNPMSPAAEVARELSAVGVTTVLVGAASIDSWHRVDQAAAGRPRLVVTPDEEGGEVTFGSLAATTPSAPVVDVAPDTVAALLFTSGTAGSPKAAILTHGNLKANIDQGLAQSGGIRSTDVIYGVLPLFHIFGLNVVLGLGLAAGASILLVQRFDPSTAVESIRDRWVTVIPGAPPMWLAFSQFIEAPPEAFRTVRLALTGAAKMPEEAARTFERRFGVPIREGYGLTEAGPVVTSSVGVEPKVGTVGVPLPGVSVRLIDENGGEVLEGDAGEILVRGPNVFAGYWQDPVATARAIDADGWLHTGDLGVVNDGYFAIVDRAKDLIIVSGFNVYPAEVEEVLAGAPGVRDVAVVGVPHPHSGEAVKAYVVAEHGVALDEDRLIGYCSDHLARYKCPSKILFVDELPHGLGGKLLRRELR